MIGNRLPVLLCLVAVLGIAGCHHSDDVAVEGTVAYDGKPVAVGVVSFIPPDEKQHSQAAIITDGRFQAMVRPGPKRVEIRGSRPMKVDPRFPDLPPGSEDFIPAKFNSASTLSAEIRPTGENRLDFDLRP